MKTSEFDYHLPEGLIATHPAEPRDSARLLVLDKDTGKVQDNIFSDLSDMLTENDVLVLNKSKVIPARLHATVNNFSVIPGRKPGTHSFRSLEVLLVKQAGDLWECWIRNGKKLKIDDELNFSEKLNAKYKKRENEIFYLDFNLKGAEFYNELSKIGEMPIPPYILKARHSSLYLGSDPKYKLADSEDYQTIYAQDPGSVAAPTAGLHFTEELLERLRRKGVQIEYVTLHVGLGTFQPLNTENIEDFQIHSEYYEIDPETAVRLSAAKADGKRIIAVGTTSVRVLESASLLRHCEERSNLSRVIPGRKPGISSGPSEGDPRIYRDDKLYLNASFGETSIYIYPGYQYRFVDAMITNFHLPKSSLLLLVSAFAGKENIEAAYQHAIIEKYRFYSYGDAMFIE